MPSHLSADQTNGELTLHTGRAGVGSKVGHDLVIRVGTWSLKGMIETDTLLALKLIARLSSLEVLRGDGGLKPLSDKDKRTILGNAEQTLQAAKHPELVFESKGLAVGEGVNHVAGTVSLAGVDGPQALDVTVRRTGSSAQVTVHGELLQSAFGIKPYSGMLGALKVRDMVEIRAELTVEIPS